MAAMGLLEDVYRLPMISPKAESKEKIAKVLKELGLLEAALVEREGFGERAVARRH
jgi:hypothetical protein